MGGPNDAQDRAQEQQAQIANQQFQIAQESQRESQEDRARRIELQAPLITKETALASGDAKAALSAAAPELATITRGFNAARENIYNTSAPGAARDYALTQVEANKDYGTASTLAREVQSAPEILANVGSGQGAFSLQELGASLAGYGGSAGTNKDIYGEATQQKATQLGFLSSLAETAGGVVGAKIEHSDRRAKDNIRSLHGALARLLQLRPVNFQYRTSTAEEIGLIAQEAGPHFPEIVREMPDGILGVNYGALAAISVAAIQELAKTVEYQSRQIHELERRVREAAVHA